MIAGERITHDAARISRIYYKRLTTAVECRSSLLTWHGVISYFVVQPGIIHTTIMLI
jgi:hypothetical protein